jgi:isopentenyl-diphosphate Delta-isomerase
VTAREEHLVELVDSSGAAVGTTTVSEAHQAPGRLHRAFSVFIRDADGRVLLQQRAAVKTRFPLRWANTCCGHPAPGEELGVAAARRLVEELGVTGVSLTTVGVYSYYAEDPATGRVEYEYDHVLLGELPAGSVPQPDPAEVADVRWVSLPELIAEIDTGSRTHAPWLAGVTAQLAASAGADDSHSAVADDSPGRSGDR